MKYIPAEKLIAEIERLKGQLIRGACAAQVDMETNCKNEAYNEVLSFITYLQQEQPSLPSNLDEAAQKVEDYYDVGEEHGYLYCHCGDIEDAFKAGAEWMAEQFQQEQPEVDLEKVVRIDNIIMTMLGEDYNSGYKTRPFYEEVLRRLNARKEE